ncbi:MAG: CBS domain-containing protein, partial [Nitrospirota bacterium]|nr:CBS domain-containing protein [Nitrospirota bacterium]
MLNEDVLEFLKGLPVSRALDNAHLKKLVNFLVMKFYPAGTLILNQHDPPGQVFRIIKQGGVMIYVQAEPGERHILDYRGEGETFGSVSLMDDAEQNVSALAIEDTVCFEIGRSALLKILEDAPAITELFRESHPGIYRHVTYGEILRKNLLYGESEKLLFTTPVLELCRKVMATAGKDLSVAEAAKLMSFHRMSSLVIVDGDGVPAGIITDTDLRDKVLALSRPPDDPVSTIMSTDLITVSSTDFCFEALLKMINNDIHHLVVVESRRLAGVLSSHDFMMLQGMSPLFFVKEIEKQDTIEGLVSVSRRSIGLISLLLREGAKASNITRIVTEVNDHLERRILDIARKTLGSP